MKEINDEIKKTINLMQTVNDACVYSEMQDHLKGLLEIKRNELQQRLVERSWLDHADGIGGVVSFDQAPYKSVRLEGQIADEVKPLTAEALKAGEWWCADISEECRRALIKNGMEPLSASWNDINDFSSCCLQGTVVVRFNTTSSACKQIHRVGNEFYWSDK